MILVIRIIKKMLIIVLLSAVGNQSAFAEVGIAFSSGQGIQNIVPYRVSLSWETGIQWREQASWGLNLIWENSFALWDGPRRPDLAPDRVTDLHAFTSGPLFRWQRWASLGSTSFLPYAEAGVGLSWLSKTEIEGRVLSLHFQFEDKAGIGMRFGNQQQYDMSFRVYHYSNASIKRPNSGVNLAMASIGLWFQ